MNVISILTFLLLYFILRNNLGLSKTGVPVLFVSFVIILFTPIYISIINFFCFNFEKENENWAKTFFLSLIILIGELVKTKGFVFIVN